MLQHNILELTGYNKQYFSVTSRVTGLTGQKIGKQSEAEAYCLKAEMSCTTVKSKPSFSI